MRLEKVKYKKKTIAYIHLHLDYNMPIHDKNRLISYLSKNIKDSTIGYAGFKTKRDLRNYLTHAVFDPGDNKGIPKFSFNKRIILGIIKNAITSCHKIIPGEPTNIFVFPTFSTFVEKKMSGTTGFTPWENTILIFINILNQKWKKSLSETIAHEFSHSVVLKYNKWETLLDSIIFEGLAEHFREHSIGGKRAQWTKSLSINQGKKMFLKLKKYLNSKNPKIYQSVFFEDKNYPLWTGYTIGYQIVCFFIKNNRNLNWKQIITLSPKEILERSNF